VRRYLWDGEVISLEKADAVVRSGIGSFEDHGFGFWAVREKGRPDLIGFAGFRFVEPAEDVEILYGIRPALWRRGYATEAAGALLAWAFRETGLPRIFAGADAPNRASFRVIEKLGMRYHGIRPTAASETPYYVIERDEFQGLSAARDNPG
jgi:RimJ/RimL family protein N-acetyltransferase